MRVAMNLDVQEMGRMDEDISAKIADFKKDPEKMNEMSQFVDEMLVEAQSNAEIKLQKKMEEEKPKSSSNNLLSGFKRGRVATRARGIVLRIFEAICNCTNSGPIPVRRTSSSATSAPKP